MAPRIELLDGNFRYYISRDDINNYGANTIYVDSTTNGFVTLSRDSFNPSEALDAISGIDVFDISSSASQGMPELSWEQMMNGVEKD